MSYILAVVTVLALFVGLHFLSKLKIVQKISISIALLVVILFAIAYNSYSDRAAEQVRDVILKYQQGKLIECSNIEVNSTNFTYSKGTKSFLAKEHTPHAGLIIDAEQCR